MLDECDEMLNMGFVEDVEKILGAGGDIQVCQLYDKKDMLLRLYNLPRHIAIACPECAEMQLEHACIQVASLGRLLVRHALLKQHVRL